MKQMSIENAIKEAQDYKNKLISRGFTVSEIADIMAPRHIGTLETDVEHRVGLALEYLRSLPQYNGAGIAFYIKNEPSDLENGKIRKFAVSPKDSDKEFPESLEKDEIQSHENNFIVLPTNASGFVLIGKNENTTSSTRFLKEYVDFNLTTTVKNALKYDIDLLTGVLRKDAFDRRYKKSFDGTRESQVGSALMVIDVDYLKKINDTLGHLAGNSALREFAGLLKKSIRESDIVGRFGGDEFCIFMPGIALEDAKRKGEDLSGQITKYNFEIEPEMCKVHPGFNLTGSVGIAHFPEHAIDEQDLFAHADEALYHVKHVLGRGKSQVYHRSMKRQ